MTALCSLCINFCNEFINLFDEKGQTNEAYEIAMRYFDPKLLKPQEHDLTLICTPCWSHISDFYNFQQSVINSQIKLEDDESWLEQLTIISLDETNDIEPITTVLSTIEADMKYSFPNAEENKTIIDLKSNVTIPELNNNQVLDVKKCFNNEIINTQINSFNSKKRLPFPNIHKAMEYDAIIHKWKSVLECDICRSKLCGYYFLRQHFFQYHPNEKFYVTCCQRKFKNRFDLVEHIRFHINRNAYQCKICGKALSCNRNLTRHIREVHVEKMACIAKLSKTLSKVVEQKPYFPNINATHNPNRTFKHQKSSYFQNKKKLASNADLKIACNLELNRTIVSKTHRSYKKLSLKLRNSTDYDTLIADVKHELECPICNIIITRFSVLCKHFENVHPHKKILYIMLSTSIS